MENAHCRSDYPHCYSDGDSNADGQFPLPFLFSGFSSNIFQLERQISDKILTTAVKHWLTALIEEQQMTKCPSLRFDWGRTHGNTLHFTEHCVLESHLANTTQRLTILFLKSLFTSS